MRAIRTRRAAWVITAPLLVACGSTSTGALHSQSHPLGLPTVAAPPAEAPSPPREGLATSPPRQGLATGGVDGTAPGSPVGSGGPMGAAAPPPGPPVATGGGPSGGASGSAGTATTGSANSGTNGVGIATSGPAVTVGPFSGTQPAPPPEAPVCTELDLTLRTDSATYRVGGQVRLTATLRNTGATACAVFSGADHGFAVRAGAGTVWLGGCSYTAGGHTGPNICPESEQIERLAPGQVLTRTQDWAEQEDASATAPVRNAPPGAYQAVEVWGGRTATAGFTIS